MDEREVLIPQEEFVIHGCGGSAACDPRRRLHRYLMLFFICFLSFGSYFCFDNPAALQDVMLKTLHMTVTEFMNLYAFYSWPNVVLCFVGGFLIDRVFGICWGAIFFGSVVLIGQLIFALGVLLMNTPVMLLGRFIFGIGGESLAVAQNTYSTVWYRPSEFNFVFGLQLSMARVGSTVTMNVMQPLYRAIGNNFNITGNQQVAVTLFIASVTCIFSLICAAILGYFYQRYLRILREETKWKLSRNGGETSGYGGLSSIPIQQQSLPEESLLAAGSQEVPSELDSDKSHVPKVTLCDVVHFPGALWLICVICVTYYVAVFPFVSLGLVFFERKYNLPPAQASAVNSMVYVVSAVASPVFGAAIDFTGRNLVWVISGVLLTVVCHTCFALTSGGLPPIVIMIGLGLAYSILASSLWPLVGIVLPAHQRGTAYGLIQSVQNLGLGVISLLAGYLVDAKGYLYLEMFFILCLSFAFAASFGLYVWDRNNGGLLNTSGAKRREYAELELSSTV